MVRRVIAGLGVATVVVVNAPVIGEPDRSASRAVGLLRAIQTAQELHFANHGYYDTLQCLASLACVGSTGAGESYQGLLAADVAALKDYHGYKLFFYPGTRSAVPGKTPTATPLNDYAMVLVPVKAEKPTMRAFCGDRTGRIFAIPGTRIPRVENGRCLDTSNPLQ